MAEAPDRADGVPQSPEGRDRVRYLGWKSKLFLSVLLFITLLSTAGQLRRTRRLLNNVSRTLQAQLTSALFASDGEDELEAMEDDSPAASLKAYGAASGSQGGNLFDAVLDAINGNGDENDDGEDEEGDEDLDEAGADNSSAPQHLQHVDPLEQELLQASIDGGWAGLDVPWRFDPNATPEPEDGTQSGTVRRKKKTPKSPKASRSRTSSPDPPKPKAKGASPTRSSTPTPSRSSSPKRYPRKRPDKRPLSSRYSCPANRKYLHLLATREGMSAWTHIVFEAAAMAGHLKRTLVEPCVSGGMLLPCRPGRVLPIPETLEETDYPVTAEDDPLAVPAFKEHCAAPKGSAPKQVVLQKGRTYPLSLYMNLPRLRKLHPNTDVISFEEWVECELRRNAKTSDVSYVGGRIRAPLGYCVTMRAGSKSDISAACKRRDVGRYSFREVWKPWDTDEIKAGNADIVAPGIGHVHATYGAEFEADVSRNMFLFEVWRGFWKPYGTFSRVPSFNPIHSKAVAAWVKARIGAPQPHEYAVFNWRSEGVSDARMPTCAKALGAKAAPIIAALLRNRKVGAVLVGDIPAPENPCRLWHVYAGSSAEGGNRRVALETLQDAGMVKYDGDHVALDAGVLSIRDWLLAVNAKWYVTCHGPGGSVQDECSACFRLDSKYVARILAARAKAGRASFTRWFKVTPAKLGLAAAAKQKKPSR